MLSKERMEAEQKLNPVRGTKRYQYDGFYDKCHAKPGVPTSRDPELVERYLERQRQLGLPGVWRNGQYPNNGTQRDVPYYIIEW
jgi:hypothetical protein